MTPAVALIAQANRIAYAAVMTRTAGSVGAVWSATVADASDETMAAFASRYAGLVGSGQRIAAQQAARGAWRLLGASAGLPGHAPSVEVASVAASDAWASSPVLRLRKHLGDGLTWEEAKALAGIYAGDLSTGDVAKAAREGAQQAAGHAERILGVRIAWAKVPARSACSWCELVSSQLYKSATAMPAHLSDHCGFRPITETEDDAVDFTNSRTVFRRANARG